MRVDEIRREMVIDAPIERVWEALTSAEHLSQWFGDFAEVDLRPGGRARFGWSEYDNMTEAIIETVERPARFSFKWEALKNTPLEEAATLVQFDLEPLGKGTKLVMVESGFASLSDADYEHQFSENDSGWTAELGDLIEYLEKASSVA